MLFGLGGMVNHVIEVKHLSRDPFFPNLAAADAFAAGTAPLHLLLNVLPQAGILISSDHIGRGDIPDDAVDPAITGHPGFDICDQIQQGGFRIRLVVTAVPVPHQLRSFQQLAGVDLDLIRAISAFAPHPQKILTVAGGGCPQQVGHPMQDHFKPACTQQSGGFQGFPGSVAAFVQSQDAVIKTLGTHLHLGDPQAPVPG